MADTSSKHNILVTDNGSLKNVNKSATELKNTLDAAGMTAERTASKVKKASAPTPIAAARAARDMGGQASEDSGTARGVGGLTGAAGRDFAKQSQGLGGLVRLYATFAANIFAATAAFGALSRAMDTTNMVKGLDQLGASSGKSLGSLAKQVALAADGAVSLRESMEAVSKASSAGMSNKQILDMADSAKKASQALGVNMSDAISRLTRGISKLEPELLDELGLFTKVDKSTQDYAKSIGKSVLALSDFEKRQAFANAVLKEAKDKFSVIDIPANPYSKLLASFQNIAQVGLELVNKVLGPIVNLLSQSPAALATVMGLIGITLLKTAIPAVGMWKDGLKNAADEARKTAKAFRESFGDEFQSRMEARFSIPDIKKKLEATEAALAATQKRIAAASTPNIASVNKLKAGSTEANDIKNAEAAVKRKQAALDKEAAGGKALSDAKRTQNQKEIEDITKILALKEKEIALTNERLRQQRALGLATATLQDLADKPLTRFDPEKLAEAKLLKLEKAATKGSLIASAATNATIIGVRNSMALLNKEITEKGLVGWDKWTTQIKGGGAAVMSRLMGIAGAFSNVTMIIGSVVAGFQILDALFSSNSKELVESKIAFEALQGAIASTGRTIDAINKKDSLASISTESINARATAVNELASAFEDSFQKLKATEQAANGWDRFIDGWKSLVGGGLLKNSARDFAASMAKALDATTGSQKTNATAKLKQLLGVDPRDIEQVYQLLAKSPQKIIELTPRISAVLRELGMEMGNVASYAKQLDESFTTAGKAFDAVIFSAVPSDNISKLGMESINVGKQMAEAFKDPAVALGQLANIAGDLSKLRFMDPDSAKELYKLSPAIKKNAAELQNYKNILADLSTQESDIINKRKEIESKYPQKDATLRNKQLAAAGIGDAQLKAVQELKARVNGLVQAAQATMEPYLAKLNTIQSQVFNKGALLVESAITQGFSKAGMIVSKAYASLLSGGTGAIESQERLSKAEIDTQIQSINVTKNLIDTQEELRRTIEESNIIEAQLVLAQQYANPTLYGKTQEEIARELAKLSDRFKALSLLKTGIFDGPNAGKALRDAREGKGTDDNSPEVRRMAAQGFTPAYQSKLAINAKLAEQQAAKRAIEIEKEGKLIELNASKDKEALAVKASGLTLQKTQLDYETRLLPYLDQATISRKEELEKSMALNKQLQDRLPLETQIAKARKSLELSLAGGDTKQARAAVVELGELYTKLAQDNEKYSDEEINRAITNTIFRMDNDKKEFDQRLALSNIVFAKEVNNSNTLISLQEESMNILSGLGSVSQEYIAAQTTSINLAKEELRSKEAIQAATTAILQAEFAKKQLIATSGINAAGVETYNAQIAASQQLIANEKQLSNIKLVNINLQGKFNETLAQQNALMSTMVDITTTLSDLFGEAGNTMGKAMETIAATAIEYSKAQERNVALQERMFELQNSEGVDSEKEKLKLQKEITKSETSSYIAVSKGIASVAASAKNMFKERSAGYKLLSAVEKAAHVATLAMQAKELASTIASIAPSIASGVSKLIAQSGWLGFAGAAAFLALMASLGYGGGGASMPSGFDAAGQQQVQGTGQTYQEGQLVNRSGGALGDNTAKANSLNNAIDKIEQHSFSTMEYSNDMLDNLKSIKKNTEGLSAMILQSGLNTKGLDANGNVVTGVSGVKVQNADFAHKGAEYIFNALGLSQNSGIGRAAGRVSTAIFGGKTTTELQDMGIAFTGNLNSLIKALEVGGKDIGAIYQNIKTTVSGGWFRSDKVNISTETQALETIQAEAFGNIFKSIGDTVMSAAEALGKDSTLTASLIDSFDLVFKTSFEGLKPEEITAALEQEFSVTFNQLAERVLPEFQKFRKPGEEFGDTIVRLARDVQVSSLVLESSGMSIGNLANVLKQGESIQEATVRITESLIDLSGGLEKFVSQGQFFNENFLTEAERLAPIQKRVTDEMKRLGYATVDTREEFAQAVKALDLTTTSGQETYAGLMNVAEGFAEVYAETRASVNVLSDLKKRNAELRDTYDKLTLSSQAYHAKLTASYTEEERALYYVNKALEEFNTGISDAQKLLDDIAMSGFTTELEKIDYLRAKERATLESSSYAIFDLVTSLQRLQSGLAQARRDMETAGNTLRSAFSTALSAVNSAQSAVASGQKSAADRFTAAQNALSAAQSQAAQEAAQMASDMAQAAQEARNAMIDLSTSIKDFIKELVTSELGLGTAETKLQNLKSQFAETLGKAKAGDKDALSAIPEVARNLLTAAQAQSKSKIDYMKTYGLVTNELNSITTAIDRANGTTKIESSGSSASGGGSGLYEAQAEFNAAKAELEKWNKDAIEAGVDINAQQKTAIETWREANKEFLDLKDTLDKLGIKYDDLLLKPEDTIQQAIETYRNASLQVSTFTSELSAATVALSSLIASNTAAMQAAEDSKKTIMPINTNTDEGKSSIQSVGPTPPAPTAAVQSAPSVSSAAAEWDGTDEFGNAWGNPQNTGIMPIKLADNPKYEYPSYASGGFFDGGLRIVGEQGPEIEATGPSRIWSADQTRSMLQGNASNDALIAEVRALRNEVASLRMTAEQTEAHTRKTKDTLIRVSENGNSIKTTAVA